MGDIADQLIDDMLDRMFDTSHFDEIPFTHGVKQSKNQRREINRHIKEKIWVSQSGKILISQMSTTHLFNTIKMLETRGSSVLDRNQIQCYITLMTNELELRSKESGNFDHQEGN